MMITHEDRHDQRTKAQLALEKMKELESEMVVIQRIKIPGGVIEKRMRKEKLNVK